jgi:ATP-dependent 26S proteasome regulatory subunit
MIVCFDYSQLFCSVLSMKFPDDLKATRLHRASAVLLCGPPGTGKTLVSKAAAKATEKISILVDTPTLLLKVCMAF